LYKHTENISYENKLGFIDAKQDIFRISPKNPVE